MACADVTSANVVGYTTLKIESAYQIIGVNFQGVNGGSIKLNDAIPYQDGMTKAHKYAEADQIQIGDDKGGWDTFFLSDGYNAKGKDYNPALDETWASIFDPTAVTNKEIAAGQAFWYVRADKTKPAFTISIAGSVSTLPDADYEFASRYRIFANPYATPLYLNESFPYDAVTMTKAHKYAEADQIQIGDNAGGWDTFFLADGYNAKGKDYNPALDETWASIFDPTTVTNASIAVGKAAWYVRIDASKPPVQVKWTKPYDL